MKAVGTLCFIAGFMCVTMGLSILLNSFYYSVPVDGIFVRAVKHKGFRERYEKYRNLMFLHDIHGLRVKGVSVDEIPAGETEKYQMGETYRIWTHRQHPEMFRVNRKGNVRTGFYYLAGGAAFLLIMVLLRGFY